MSKGLSVHKQFTVPLSLLTTTQERLDKAAKRIKELEAERKQIADALIKVLGLVTNKPSTLFDPDENKETPAK